MLAPFEALLPINRGVSYVTLAAAAKVLRTEPASYQPIGGVEYDRHTATLYRWRIARGAEQLVEGLVGIFPLDRLIPHEATTAAALTRPRHPVQIRPVMALVETELPTMEETGPSITFGSTYCHTLTPVVASPLMATDAVIADGHHRTAAALRVGGDAGIMTMIVSASSARLEAGAFHRVFARPVDLPSAIDGLVLEPEEPTRSIAAGRISVVTPAGAVGVGVAAEEIGDQVSGIPAAIAHRTLLPALGLREEEAVYLDDQHAALVAAQYGTAVLLPGSQVASVVAAARASVALPPKSTRFRPKPVRGLLMRPL